VEAIFVLCLPRRRGSGARMASLTITDVICCWPKLLYGRACCVWNCLFAPFVLCIWACTIYLCGCCKVYFNRSFYKFCCCVCRAFNCCWLYEDTSFPPNKDSLGDIGGDTANKDEAGHTTADSAVWLRASQFARGGRMQLFGDTIDSRDICQGALGDCWLLAAIACLAEHKGAINAIFRSKERNPRGKYRLRLYDGVKEKWENIVLDDFIPCDKLAYERDGTCKPLFADPNGNELYVMLLEKAFAKFCGSFAAIEGGQTIWAIRAMTGDPARWFMQEDGKTGWTRSDLINMEDEKDRRKCGLRKTGERIDNEAMFEILRKYHRRRSVLCASGSSGRDGLHKGHAYSILDVRKIKPSMTSSEVFRLICIRNPWGSGEWTGDWGDKSDLWAKHPAIKKAVGHQDSDDGSFWMSWDDYVQNWNKIGVVDRTVDINSLRLHVEDDSACAPTRGCCGGCFTFWCCCQGPSHIYCPHRSSNETLKVQGACCGLWGKSYAAQVQDVSTE